MVGGTLKRAEKRYAAGDFAAAAADYLEVASGNIAGEVAVAELGLLRALYRLDMPSAARSWGLRIAHASRNHPMRRAALPWLVALARDLDPDPQLLDALASYGAADLEDERFDDVRGDLYYMIGRAKYGRGDLEPAVAFLGAVPEDADDYVHAQYLQAVAHTRLFKGPEAVESFKNVLRTNRTLAVNRDKRVPRYARRHARLQQRGWKRAKRRLEKRMARRDVTVADLDRYREQTRLGEMTLLSMAYVFYQAGQFDTALRYFSAVPQTSPYWLDAIFGKAWSEFLLAYVDEEDQANAHYQRVLGHVHTLRAPFFPYRLYPELPLLAAVTYYYNCRYVSASRALDDFDTRYVATKQRLDDFLDAYPEDFELADVYSRIRAGEAEEIDEPTLHVLEGLLDDEELVRRHGRIATIDAERGRVGELDSAALEESVLEEVELAASLAREEVGAAVRLRLSNAVQQIRHFERQALGVRYELAPKLVETTGAPGKADRPRADVEHDLYEYNGEYWQDELGNYRVEITSLCR